MTRNLLPLGAASATLLALVGCQSTTHTSVGGTPMASEDVDDVFTYLSERYDANGDGQITEAEYARTNGRFERLDGNDDGVISLADFESEDEGPRGRRGGARRGGRSGAQGQGMARRTLARYFQVEEDPLLPMDEMLEGFATYYDGKGDTPADGALTIDEFTCSHEARLYMVPGDDMEFVKMAMDSQDPWTLLTGQIDGDEDGAITKAEFATFYEGLEGGTIDYTDYASSMGGGRRGARGGRERVDDGLAPVGETAPDFELSTPDGSETFTLSDFAGDRPVALIFGSYT